MVTVMSPPFGGASGGGGAAITGEAAREEVDDCRVIENRGEPARLWPSLWMAKCSLPDVIVPERNWALMFCCREGSGMFRPNRLSKESRLR